MNKWTNQELDEFCEKAIELLTKKKHLQVSFVNCWLFSNSAGGNFHVVYYNEFMDKSYELSINSKILQDKKIYEDDAAGIINIGDLKLKIALRIAYFIYRSCKYIMKEDK